MSESLALTNVFSIIFSHFGAAAAAFKLGGSDRPGQEALNSKQALKRGGEPPTGTLNPRMLPQVLVESRMKTIKPSRSDIPWVAAIAGVSALLIGAVVVIHHARGTPISELTRDPAAIFSVPIYIGFLSQIGLFFWAGAASICLFSAAVLSRANERQRSLASFLTASGLLTLMLGLDDAFMVHEELLPQLGISEPAVMLAYAVIVSAYLVFFRSNILATHYVLLALAFLFFGMSVGLDLVEPADLDPHLLEDGAKLVGIVSWLTYFLRTGLTALQEEERCESSLERTTNFARTAPLLADSKHDPHRRR